MYTMQRRVQQIKVAAQSDPASVAGAVTEALKEAGVCEMLCIGAAAINQAVKALAISRGHLARHGADAVMRPAFFETIVNGQEMTGMKFIVTRIEMNGVHIEEVIIA